MSIDMSQFHGVFIEESQEHLEEIEQLLMALDTAEPDIEELNCIFRAAHSIKGGSGIFGFDALISVTHVMENLFDKARQKQFTFTPQVIDELLNAVDSLRVLLNSYKEGSEPDWQLVHQVTERVELLLGTPDAPKAVEEDGFGFFDTSDAHDEAFGFFDTPVLTAAADEGFGFFDDEPAPQTTDVSPSHQAETEPEIAARTASGKAGNTKTENTKSENSTAAKVSADYAVKAKTDSAESTSIRVDIAKIDSLVNLAGELVITQSMLNLIGAEVEGAIAERLQSALSELERNTRELQESIMSIRMLPLSFVFNRFPRVVRDLSTKLHKKVELVIEGGQTEIDKGLIERLVDPLTHLVRNSLDHGIETPDIRRQRGKEETGRLTLRAEQKGGNILISVLDDGGGLNRENILAKAAQNGIELAENATDQQVWQLIMAPGFSTAAEVTDVSGRGVGMDVVKRNIEAMGGRIEIESSAGQGSAFQIRLPLTLAILDGMSVSVVEQLFIVPLVNIIESVQPQQEQLKYIGNQQMLELRDAYWPIVRLHDVMHIDGAQTDTAQAILVLIETSKTRFALMIDELIGQQQVVIKSLEQHYRRVAGIAGATIMGDGSVALILDVESLASQLNDTVTLKDAV